MKKFAYLGLLLFSAVLTITCKDENANFSPGAGDSRIVGTWQLVERRFQKDSILYTYTIQNDSVLVDSVYVPRKDTIRTSRDTSFYTTKEYPTAPPQTLTFDQNGRLSASGTEMTYYNPTKYYKVDTTYPDSLFLNLYIYTNRANVYFQQNVNIQKDVLMLLPRCDQPCYSKFQRVR